MDGLLQDVRYALRTLRKSPAFATTTVLTLALGIGANLPIFTVVNAVLLRPLPFREPERLVPVFDDVGRAGAKNIGMSVPELEDLRRSGVFEQISAIFPGSTALSGGDRVERIELLGTSPNYFELLGARPALGQTYTQSEWVPGFLDGVVISDGLWKRQFGSDPHIIGRRVRVDEDPYTVVGVMPPNFRHPGNTLGGDVDIWTATGFSGDPFPSPPQRGRRFLPGALGRLKPGITLEQAQRRLDALATSLQQTYPNDYPKQLGWSLGIYGVMAFVVGQRAQEFGIRLALGAMPRNILGLAFRPGLRLTAAGTIVGLAASIGVARLMSGLLFGVSSNDPTTFAVVPAVLAIVTLAACFIPARRATRVSPMQALK